MCPEGVYSPCKIITKSYQQAFFFTEEGDSGAIWPGPFPLLKEKFLMHIYSIESQCLYCFCPRGCWNRLPFGPYMYFSSLLTTLQCSKRQGSFLLQVSSTQRPHSGEFYGDVLHGVITPEGLIASLPLPWLWLYVQSPAGTPLPGS